MSFAFAALAQKNNKVAGSKMSTPTKYHSAVATRNRINNSSSTDSHTEIIHLQRTIGNQAVQKLLRSNNTSGGFDFAKIGIQPKLKVSQPGDAYEQEADRVAEQVMRMPTRNSNAPTIAIKEERIGRKCAACKMTEKKEEDKELNISRKTSTESNIEADDEITNEINNIRSSGGSLLDENTRESMESRFGGYDFSNVRIHTDEMTARSARSVNATAYTIGNDIMFDEGQYTPNTLEGRRLLAHELTHVIQQVHNNNTKSRVEHRQESKEPLSHTSKIFGINSNNLGMQMLMRDIKIANPSPGGGGGKPPSGLSGCHVYLGGRFVEHWVGLLGFRHMYINVYEGPTSYALIEAGPTGGGGISGAWVKNMDWDSRGSQWEITPEDCSSFIACLKMKTTLYNSASHPYDPRYGPNSNSFAWWVLHECGLDISTLFSSWPYRGIDYWQTTHPVAPVPTTP
jgi:hypothetical protein